MQHTSLRMNLNNYVVHIIHTETYFVIDLNYISNF